MIPLNLKIVDAQGRPTPAFLKTLQQLGVTVSDSMPAPSPLNINADYTGAFLAGELPATLVLQRLSNGVDVSTQSQWAMAVVSGTITATISSGVVTVTALGSSNAMLQVKSTRNGVALYDMVSVNKVLGAAPNSSSSGNSTATCTTYNSVSSPSYGSPITTATLQVTVGASGNVSLSAPLTVSTSNLDPVATYPVYGKWQWYNGTSWVDVAAEVQSSPDCYVYINTDTGLRRVSKGTLTVNTTQTGLTPGATAKFQLLARNGSGTYVMTFSGTSSAVPQ